MIIDYFFTYKNISRFILLHKIISLKDSFSVPYLKYLFIYCFIYKTTDLIRAVYFNFPYLFKFFLGKKTFFSKLRYFSSFNNTFISFNIIVLLKNKQAFCGIFFLVNEIFPFVSKINLRKKFLNSPSFFMISILDLNLFPERKANQGLFNLEEPLNFKFFICCNDFDESFIFLNSMKII